MAPCTLSSSCLKAMSASTRVNRSTPSTYPAQGPSSCDSRDPMHLGREITIKAMNSPEFQSHEANNLQKNSWCLRPFERERRLFLVWLQFLQNP